MLPPSNYALIAITAEPTQITQKTVPKIIVETVAYDANDKVQAKQIHNINGPHKSQFFNLLPLPKGMITNLTLLNIYLTSLIIEV